MKPKICNLSKITVYDKWWLKTPAINCKIEGVMKRRAR